jgi:5-enolpyruvylshikimate-3-phosphate synthase
LKKEMPLELIGPSVSNAKGMNVCVVASVWYLSSFLLAAPSAAPPATVDVVDRYDSANVSVTVTSHVMQRPACQGICVSPSGRLPSDRSNPAGSLIAGISACVSARHTRSLMT